MSTWGRPNNAADRLGCCPRRTGSGRRSPLAMLCRCPRGHSPRWASSALRCLASWPALLAHRSMAAAAAHARRVGAIALKELQSRLRAAGGTSGRPSVRGLSCVFSKCAGFGGQWGGRRPAASAWTHPSRSGRLPAAPAGRNGGDGPRSVADFAEPKSLAGLRPVARPPSCRQLALRLERSCRNRQCLTWRKVAITTMVAEPGQSRLPTQGSWGCRSARSAHPAEKPWRLLQALTGEQSQRRLAR